MHHAKASAECARRLGERGSAPIEFIAVGLLMLVPLVYLVVTLGQIQERALGVQTASRQLARAIATAEGTEDAAARAEEVATAIAREYGIPADALGVELRCAPTAIACPQAGAVLTVAVRAEAPLPLMPALFGVVPAVPIEAATSIRVSRFWAPS